MARRRPLDPTESAAALYGFKLRQHRDKHDWTQTALADRVDCSMDLISKIERAERTASTKMSARFDEIFGTAEYFRELQPLAAREILPDWFRPVAEYENSSTALRILNWYSSPEYFRRRVKCGKSLAWDRSQTRSTSWSAPEKRQAILTGDKAPHLMLVMDEGVLHRKVGTPEVMRDQIMHLLQMAERPNITVQIVPLDVGAYLGFAGPFTVLTHEGDGDTVYVEGPGLGQLIDEPSKAEEYRLRFDLIRASALSVRESRKLIRTIVETT